MVFNMGIIDRVLRAIVAVVIGVLYIMGYISGWLAIVLGIIGAVMIFTAVSGYCPAYQPLNLSTKKK